MGGGRGNGWGNFRGAKIVGLGRGKITIEGNHAQERGAGTKGEEGEGNSKWRKHSK